MELSTNVSTANKKPGKPVVGKPKPVPSAIRTYSTGLYINVLREADKPLGNPGNPSLTISPLPGSSTQVDRQELLSYRKTLQDQLNAARSEANSPTGSKTQGGVISALIQKLDVTQILLRNFRIFSVQDSNPRSIGIADVMKVAGLDGIAKDVTSKDLAVAKGNGLKNEQPKPEKLSLLA